MKPIKTEFSNIVYHGPPYQPDVGDLPCERLQIGMIKTVWKPDPVERARIASGDNLVIIIHTEPIPPLAVEVTSEKEMP